MIEQQDGDHWVSIPASNEDFRYREMINAAYTTYSGQANDFTWQLGVRAEQARLISELVLTDQAADHTFFNLFPSLFLSYKTGENSSLQTSYSRRISRPRSRWLLPFSGYPDARNVMRGNPDLEPEYGNSLETGYLRHWESGSLLSSVYYRYRTGVIERVTFDETNEIGNPVTVRFPINLATENSWGLEFTGDQELFENFQVSGSANFFQSVRQGMYEGRELTGRSGSFQTRMRVRWRFMEGWNSNLMVRYRGPRAMTQGTRPATAFMNMGISRRMLDNALTVSLHMQDVFNSRQNNWIIDEPGFYSERSFAWTTRTARLNVRYRFN